MKVEEIQVDKIKIYQNIRSDRKDVADLMKSIEKHGLQHPIGVYKKDGSYILAYGYRRLQAIKKLNWKTIPAIIIQEEFTEEDFLTKNTIENIHREDINPVELGRVCHLFLERGFSPSEIAAKLHIPQQRVNHCSYLYRKLPEEYRDLVGYIPRGEKNKGKIPVNVAMAVMQLHLNKQQVKELLDLAKTHELSTRDIYLIDKLTRTGLSFKEVLKNLDKYVVKNINLSINKAAWKKLDYPGGFVNYIAEIIKGNEPPNKDLLI